MQLRIYFNPGELSYVEANANDIYIVIDVMRATTTLPVMFDQGASSVFAALTLEQAQEASHKVPGRLLCGERYTRTPPGFDYGNSPATFSQLDLTNRELILTTSNGTRALFACPEHSLRVTGSFYNAEAVAAYVLKRARQEQRDLAIVCAAEYGYFALEDSACAGFLALELLRQYPQLQVHDSTHGAVTIYEQYPAARLLECAQSARELIDGGLQRDLDFCLKQNVSHSVPLVVGREVETDLLQLSLVS